MSAYPADCCRSCFIMLGEEDTGRIRRCTRKAGHDGWHTKGLCNWNDEGVENDGAIGTLVPFEAWERAVELEQEQAQRARELEASPGYTPPALIVQPCGNIDDADDVG